MKPHNPEELEADGKDLPQEGMMFVGDKGKILAGFRCEKPSLIPESRMKSSPGSFLNAGPISETINLGAIALRTHKKILYDTTTMTITNIPEANKYLTREYRKGWEL